MYIFFTSFKNEALTDLNLSHNNVKSHSHQANAKTKNVFDVLKLFNDLFRLFFDLFHFHVRFASLWVDP